VRFSSSNIVSIINLFHNCFGVNKIVQINSLGGAIVLFAAYSVYACVFQGFIHRFSFPFPGLIHQFFGLKIFQIHSLGGTIILFTAYSAIGRIYVRNFPRKFHTKILYLNSSHPFARWRHRHICCLYSFLDEFQCVTLRYITFLRMYPPKTPCFILGSR